MKGYLSWLPSLLLIAGCFHLAMSIGPDNVCTFHHADKLFSLIVLQSNSPYVIDISSDERILFNFCHSFLPNECISSSLSQSGSANDQEQLLEAFAFRVTKKPTERWNQEANETIVQDLYECTPYTSNSYMYYFSTDYIKHQDEPQLVLNMSLPDRSRATQFRLFCSQEEYYKIGGYRWENDEKRLILWGQSSYGCPVFQISSLWTTLEEHSIIFGVILFVLGFQLLFYGLLMINLTVFIAGYFVSFAVLGSIFTVFLGPNSSSIAVYFSLLLILLASTLIAYGLTKLINLSIFFIGAFFGLILGALVNTIFSSIFSVHSVWSLVVFEILFTIPFGLLTFKYSNEIIILSTSLTGSYLIIRPISWLLGGFPNQFLLYEMYESRELSGVPWTFYLYLLLIIVLAIMGALYQYLKLQRQDPANTIQTNIVTENIQQPLDKIKETVDKIISRYSSSDGGEERYKRMREMEYQAQKEYFRQNEVHGTQYGQIEKQKYRSPNSDQFF